MSMHGRGITSSSMIWTVFSSMKWPPHSHAAMMFWLSCVCGPADGPMGVDSRLPNMFGVAYGASVRGLCHSDSWMPKIERLCSYSTSMRRRRRSKGCTRKISDITLCSHHW